MILLVLIEICLNVVNGMFFVPYDSKVAGNFRKVAENVDISIFNWIL